MTNHPFYFHLVSNSKELFVLKHLLQATAVLRKCCKQDRSIRAYPLAMCLSFAGPNPSLAAFDHIKWGTLSRSSRKELFRSFLSVTVLSILHSEDLGLSSTVESKVVKGENGCLTNCFWIPLNPFTLPFLCPPIAFSLCGAIPLYFCKARLTNPPNKKFEQSQNGEQTFIRLLWAAYAYQQASWHRETRLRKQRKEHQLWEWLGEGEKRVFLP